VVTDLGGVVEDPRLGGIAGDLRDDRLQVPIREIVPAINFTRLSTYALWCFP